MPLQGKIDVDRGVIMRPIVEFSNQWRFDPDMKFGGMTIYMYVDEPGHYYDVHGHEVPEAFAEAAGFDIRKDAKERHRREALSDFNAELQRQLDMEDEDEVILAEAGDWKVVALPANRAKIVDTETGRPVTAAPMPRDDALSLLKKLAGTADEVKEFKIPLKGKSPAAA